MKTDNGYAPLRGVDACHQAEDEFRPDHETHDRGEPSSSIMQALHRRAEQGFALPIYDLPQITGFTLAECFGSVRMLEFEKLAKLEDDPADPFGAKLVLLDEGSEKPHTFKGRNAG